jgi:hypothetical protein
MERQLDFIFRIKGELISRNLFWAYILSTQGNTTDSDKKVSTQGNSTHLWFVNTRQQLSTQGNSSPKNCQHKATQEISEIIVPSRSPNLIRVVLRPYLIALLNLSCLWGLLDKNKTCVNKIRDQKNNVRNTNKICQISLFEIIYRIYSDMKLFKRYWRR